MEATDRIGVRGEVHLTVVRGDLTPEETTRILARDIDSVLGQRLVSHESAYNLVTNTGRANIATIVATGTTRPLYIGVGNTAITPAVTSTALSGEINRNAITTSVQFATYYARFAVTFASGDFNDTVRGIGLFTSSSGGDMWALVSSSVVKDASSALVCDWRLQITTV
jgi:hypothetical protein